MMQKEERKVTFFSCSECGKDFAYWLSEVRAKPPKFCSHDCHTKNRFRDYVYPYNTEFLNEINEFSAYFLGMFVTDGHLTEREWATKISLTDKQIIDDIAKVTEYTAKIVYNKSKQPNRKDKWTLSYTGPMADKLIEFGFPPGRKTGKELIPNVIYDAVLPHFLRGTIDGDGCFCILTKYGTLVCSVASASKSFLEDILNRLRRLHIVYGGAIQPHMNIYSLVFKHNDAIAIGDYIYKNEHIKLNRKYAVYMHGKTRGIFHVWQRGKPCSVEGCTETCHSKGMCKKHFEEWYRKNPKRKEYTYNYNKEYYKKNREKLCEQMRAYGKKHRQSKKDNTEAQVIRPASQSPLDNPPPQGIIE